MKPHITLAAETITHIWNLPITNTMLTTWIVMAFLLFFGLITVRNLRQIPDGLQNFIEMIIEGIYSIIEAITKEKTKTFFSLLATLFLFIMFGNWVGLLPGVGSIGFFKLVEGEVEFTPLFRGATADLNTTFALAIVAVLALQYYGAKTLGSKYFSRYFNIRNPLLFFVGLLEIISEFARVISFAFRLFGNIFAGEVLLTIIAFLMPLFAPLPFLGLELFVGFIQAFIFVMLTSVFLRVATLAEEH